MAECVSCGKKIPTGKFFCDDCYVKMKGRRGPFVKAAKQPEEKKAAEPGPSPQIPAGRSGISGDTAPAAGVIEEPPERKPSGALTPSSIKKVVALRPAVDKGSRDGEMSEKRFSVTITFSERTYAALDRMKGKIKRKKPQQPEVVPEVGDAEAAPGVKPSRRARHGPHGRPKLKAVGNVSSSNAKRSGYLIKMVKYREREWDRGDLATALMATGSTIFIIVLSLLDWVKVSWIAEGGVEVQAIGVKGISLGYLVYMIIAVAAVAWLYMAITAARRRPPIDVDPGLVLLVAGIIVVPLIFIARSSNQHVYNAALNILRGRGMAVPGNISGYEVDTAWPVFIMILAGFVMAFSGLIRLSQRREETAEKAESGGGGT